jgi:hypothetical protein
MKKFRWRTATMCEDCPFAARGKGQFLRKTLRPGRWREILKALRCGNHFLCHKTTRETGNGSKLVCAGAIAWQKKRRCPSVFQQLVERLTA